MNLDIIDHSASKRIQNIKVKEKELEKLIFPFNKHSIQSLEYKPFSRFSLAKSIDDVFDGEGDEAFTPREKKDDEIGNDFSRSSYVNMK